MTVQGPEGLLNHIAEGGFLIDSSTVDPALSKELAAKAAGTVLLYTSGSLDTVGEVSSMVMAMKR